jgi:hypothetical protein
MEAPVSGQETTFETPAGAPALEEKPRPFASQIQWRTKKSRRGYGASYKDRLFDLPLERLAPFAEIAAVEPVTDEEASTER